MAEGLVLETSVVGVCEDCAGIDWEGSTLTDGDIELDNGTLDGLGPDVLSKLEVGGRLELGIGVWLETMVGGELIGGVDVGVIEGSKMAAGVCVGADVEVGVGVEVSTLGGRDADELAAAEAEQ